jgi:hypothetical protein
LIFGSMYSPAVPARHVAELAAEWDAQLASPPSTGS